MFATDFRRKWLSSVYEAYADDVFNVIRFRLRPVGLGWAAADVLQDVFLTAFAKYERLNMHPDIRRWLFATANFKCKNLIRKHAAEGRRIVWDADAIYLNAVPDPSAERAFVEVLNGQLDCEELIRRVKAEMSEGDAVLYAQAYEERVHPAQLSKAYGISEAAMRMRISRMRQRILCIVKNLMCMVLLFLLTDILK